MKLFAFVVFVASWPLVITSCTENTADSPLTYDIWQYYQYKNRFNKSHDTLEVEQRRFRAFQESLCKINEFNNRAGETYKQGLNQLSDMTHDEFVNGMISRIIDANKTSRSDVSWLRVERYEPPPFIDYSDDQRRVGPMRDQGPNCASGYAMATTGLLEGQEIRNETHQVIPLSVQNIIDCDKYDAGCTGGSVEWALHAIRDEGGLNTDQTYPYEGRDTHLCRYNKSDPFITTMYIQSITDLKSGDEEMLQKTVAKYGPVPVSLDASLDSFKSYQSGVYYDSQCTNHTSNHHMLVVGYGTTGQGQAYWKLKNSWSTDWGLSGYMLLARNRGNHCGVATKATIVEVYNQPPESKHLSIA